MMIDNPALPHSPKPFISCAVCGQPCDSAISPFCSRECDWGADSARHFGRVIIDHKSSDDKRIFFFDFSFGDLCDLYCVTLLRRVYKKNLAEQRTLDHQLERLERAILTKLNRFLPIREIRQGISASLAKLYSANARLWQWSERWMAPGAAHITDADMDSMRAARAVRDAARKELDFFIDGKSINAVKTYGG